MSRCVAILEPSLWSAGRHYLNQTESFCEELVNQGRLPRVFCGSKPEEKLIAKLQGKGAEVVPMFLCRHLERLKVRDLTWMSTAACFALTLRRLADRIAPDEPVLLPSADLDTLLGLAAAQRLGWWPHRTSALLFTWDRRAHDPARSLIPGAMLELTRRAVRSCSAEQMLLFGCSRSVAAMIQREVELPVRATVQAVEWKPAALGPRSQADPLVSYLGELRPEKGFDQFLEALPLLRSHPRLEVRAAPADLIPEARRQELINRVRDRGGSILEQAFSLDHFNQQLRRADIIVCPYTPERYRERTSRIVIESLGLGAVPIVPEGTWLSEMVTEYGAGEIYSPYSAEALAGGIDRVVQGWSDHRERAAQAAERVRRDHSPGAVLEAVLAPLTGGHR